VPTRRRADAQTPSQLQLQLQQLQLQLVVTVVTVEAARGLLAMDNDTSSSDPLVKLALHG
jgi:hypothetical protein